MDVNDMFWPSICGNNLIMAQMQTSLPYAQTS